MRAAANAAKNNSLTDNFGEKLEAVANYILQQVTSGTGTLDTLRSRGDYVYNTGNMAAAQFTSGGDIESYFNKMFPGM